MIAQKDRATRSRRLIRSQLTNRARDVLEESPLFRGRSNLICIKELDGQLVLEGRLPSYYLKQMLQTVLRDIEGVRQIDNRVTVDWPIEG